MKTLHLNKLAAATGLVFACAAGSAQALSIGDNFTITQSPVSVGGVIADIDHVNFSYTAKINQQDTGPGPFLSGFGGGDHFNESGRINFTGYIDDAGNPVVGSALNFDYKMYALFTADGTAQFGGIGLEATFSSFALQFYLDDFGNTTFNDSANGIAAVTTNFSGDDKLFATASLTSASAAHLAGGLANGDFQINMTDFGLNLFGASFLTAPNPFYKEFFFTGVTTTVTGANPFGPFLATAVGSGDMAFSVPEPTSISLLGIGLLGFGAASLRRKQQA